MYFRIELLKLQEYTRYKIKGNKGSSCDSECLYKLIEISLKDLCYSLACHHTANRMKFDPSDQIIPNLDTASTSRLILKWLLSLVINYVLSVLIKTGNENKYPPLWKGLS